MEDPTDFASEDLYGLLEVEPESSSQQITKAYRKLALKLHPDKNPSKDAAEKFSKLSKIYELLLDEKARKAYDDVRKAKHMRKERETQMDAKRRQMMDDLKERESGAKRRKDDEGMATKRLAEEIARLRKEGFERRQKATWEREGLFEWEKSTRPVRRPTPPQDASAADGAGQGQGGSMMESTVKVSWDRDVAASKGMAYSEAVMRGIMGIFGDIDTVVISPTRGTAVICYKTVAAAEKAINWYQVGGREFKVSWAAGKATTPSTSASVSTTPNTASLFPSAASSAATSNGSAHGTGTAATPVCTRDYESLTMHRLRQAAERQKMIERIQQEEGAGQTCSSSTTSTPTPTPTPNPAHPAPSTASAPSASAASPAEESSRSERQHSPPHTSTHVRSRTMLLDPDVHMPSPAPVFVCTSDGVISAPDGTHSAP